jgi:heme exporter protein D
VLWNSVGEFFDMGGYALYVWGSVIVTFGFMAAELLILALRRRTILDYLGRVRRFEDEEMGDEGQA